MSPKKFNVLVGEINAALLFCSTNESRFALNGVHFEIGRNRLPLMVATDGRRLCAIETEAQQDLDFGMENDFIVSAAFLKPLCAFAKTQAAIISIEYHRSKRAIFSMVESHCVVDSESGGVIELSYPDWRQTIPVGERSPMKELGLNAAYMADFAKAGKFLGVETPCVRMNLISDDSALEVHITGKSNFYGIIMPTKQEEQEKWQPEFVGMAGLSKS